MREFGKAKDSQLCVCVYIYISVHTYIHTYIYIYMGFAVLFLVFFLKTDASNISCLSPLQYPYFALLISYCNSNTSVPFPPDPFLGPAMVLGFFLHLLPVQERSLLKCSYWPGDAAFTDQVRAELSSLPQREQQEKFPLTHTPRFHETFRNVVFLTFLTQ